MTPLGDLARAMFAAAVGAVLPDVLMRRVEFAADGVELAGERCAPAGRLVLIALGKAAGGLAGAFLQRARRRPDVTFVLAPYGAPVPPSLEHATHRGGHPTPDTDGEHAAALLLDLLAGLGPDDGVVLLLSGGASALLAQPLPAVERAEAFALAAALSHAGATIGELNAVRKHVFAGLGGRLAATTAASMLTLALSDVPGDALDTIASGPTVGDPTTFADAVAVLARYRQAEAFPSVARFLAEGARGAYEESPKPGDARLANARAVLLGSNREALAAAAEVASRSGFRSVIVSRRMVGEARELGFALAALAISVASGEPIALLLGGESTVTVTGDGCGGRNLELALAAGCGLAGMPERCLLAAGTDGLDGASPAAGAVVDGATLARGVRLGRDAHDALRRNDSWGFFAGLPDPVITGPTGTNVADMVLILIGGQPALRMPSGRSLGLSMPAADPGFTAESVPHRRRVGGVPVR